MWVPKSALALLLSAAAATAFVPAGRVATHGHNHALPLRRLTTAAAPLGSPTRLFMSTPADPDKSQRGYEPLEDDDPLDEFGVDLTAQASAGKLDPVIGRDDEIRRAIQILSRRTKNNPIVIGDPGVGKTAIAEGIAQRIVSGDVPDSLKDCRLVGLDMGALIAGASYRGEFEERLKKVVDRVKDSEGGIILFINEVSVALMEEDG